jgi:hypothetical protein
VATDNWRRNMARAQPTGAKVSAILVVLVAFVAALGWVPATGAAAPAPSQSASSSIRPGSSWTFRLEGGGCEIDTFHANGTFTTAGSDRGVFRVNGSNLRMRWTHGGNATTSFAGVFTRSIKGYSGEWTAGGENIAATLTPGRTCA